MSKRDAPETGMTPAEDPLLEAEESPLVERLRQLDWPAVDPTLRERSWERFKTRLTEHEDGA